MPTFYYTIIIYLFGNFFYVTYVQLQNAIDMIK